MYYEINVALNGKHLFATAKRSLTSELRMKECLKVFMEKFPESEGYSISVERIECVVNVLDVNKILDKE